MRLKKFFKEVYGKLARINDSNQKISLGFGLGVFLGLFPGTGPIISLILAAAFRVNKAAALLGCLLTNTWLSFVTAILAVKVGAAIFHLNWLGLWQEAKIFSTNFNFLFFLNSAVLKFFAPVLVGFLIIAFCAALIAYLTSFLILKSFRKTG